MFWQIPFKFEQQSRKGSEIRGKNSRHAREIRENREFHRREASCRPASRGVVNHWWPYLKRPHTTHGHGFEHVRDRLVDDRAFFALNVDSPLYLRRKSCYRTSAPASFMITSDTLVPWRWKNAHENWSRRAFPIKFCRSSLTAFSPLSPPLTSLQNISLFSDPIISISLMVLSLEFQHGLKLWSLTRKFQISSSRVPDTLNSESMRNRTRRKGWEILSQDRSQFKSVESVAAKFGLKLWSLTRKFHLHASLILSIPNRWEIEGVRDIFARSVAIQICRERGESEKERHVSARKTSTYYTRWTGEIEAPLERESLVHIEAYIPARLECHFNYSENDSRVPLHVRR